jgi:hypothetical protein
MCAVPAGASAVELGCGATITEDTVLTADVVCGENQTGEHGYALLVAADNVWLDLRDHQVGSDWNQGLGVVGRSGVTITGYGGYGGLNSDVIELRDTTDSHIQGVRVGWLDLQGSDRNRITRSQAHIGLREDSDDNVVEHNDAGGEGGGVTLTVGSDRNVVRNNTICGGMGDPLYITDDASHNLIEHNFVPACMGLSGTGMSITGTGTGNRLVNNLVIGGGLPNDPEFGPPGDGIRVESPGTFLSGNITNNHEGYGINAVEGVESDINYARGNLNPAQCLNVLCVPGGTDPSRPAGPSAPPGPAGPGVAPPAAADLTPPFASLAAKKRQRFGRTVKLTVSATSEDVWVSASGRLSIRGATKAYRLDAKDRFVARGSGLTLKLVLPVAARKAVRRALDHGRQVRVTLTLRVRDQVGNSSASKRTVKIEP